MSGLHYLGKPWQDDPEPPDEGVWEDDDDGDDDQPLNEDWPIDQVMEDTLSPPIED